VKEIQPNPWPYPIFSPEDKKYMRRELEKHFPSSEVEKLGDYDLFLLYEQLRRES